MIPPWLTILMLACASAAFILLSRSDSCSRRGWEDRFNRQIRSILSNRCFACAVRMKEREGDLRFDTVDGAFAPIWATTPKPSCPASPEESSLIERITSSDPDLRMPPATHGEPLSPTEVKLLTDWIKQGAEFARRWSYRSRFARNCPQSRTLPGCGTRSTGSFFRGSNAKGFRQLKADRYALIRRVSLDLTGLPPTLEEVDQFLADKSADAYENSSTGCLLDKETYENWSAAVARLARYARLSRLRGRSAANDLGVSRLRHPVAEREQAVRPVHHRADRRRPAARPDRGSSSRRRFTATR